MTDRPTRIRRGLMATLGIFSMLLAADAVAQPRWGRPTAPRSGACFYRDVNFEGDYFCASAGEEIPVLPPGMNDQISSIRTFGDAEVRVFQDVRFGGRSENFDRSIRDLRKDGWNDRLSSARIREGRAGGGGNGGGRRENPDRVVLETMTRPKAEAIVARAYRSVLNRDPDPASAPFVEKVLREKWTQQNVEDELRKSAEYRNKKR